MKEELYIGNKYYGKIWKNCKWFKGQVLYTTYLLSIWTFKYTEDGKLYEHHVGLKEYRFKQSAIRYIKNNF